MRLYGGWSFRRAGKDYGWLLAVIIAILAVTVVYTKAPAQVGLPLPTKEELLPAAGVGGYNVLAFCEDPLTEVKFTISPDTEGSVTFQLTRTRDGKFESITWVSGAPTARHFEDVPGGGQIANPGVVTDKAADCILDQAGLNNTSLIPSSSPSAAVVRPGQPHHDIFQVSGITNLQVLNPTNQKVIRREPIRYGLVTMPGCIPGSIPQDLDRATQELVKAEIQLTRSTTQTDFTIRINCGNDHIRICGSINIFCLGRGFPQSCDIDLSDILSNWQELTRLSILLHELMHCLATWNEQYCLGTEVTGPCAGLARFTSTPNWSDIMNTGPLSRHGLDPLELERVGRTLYALMVIDQYCCNLVYPGWEGTGSSRYNITRDRWEWTINIVGGRTQVWHWSRTAPTWRCNSGCP
jgi:hypothetical protein